MADGDRHPGGRPTSFCQRIADSIVERIADGESLRSICSENTMPSRSMVFRWLGQHEEFRDQYARAREAQADALFDEMLEIADDGSNDWMERKDKDGGNIGWRENGEAVRRSALRVDARKWMAAKLQPKRYGDKVDMNLKASVNLEGAGIAGLIAAVKGGADKG